MQVVNVHSFINTISAYSQKKQTPCLRPKDERGVCLRSLYKTNSLIDLLKIIDFWEQLENDGQLKRFILLNQEQTQNYTLNIDSHNSKEQNRFLLLKTDNHIS